jgi:hypothetical protein
VLECEEKFFVDFLLLFARLLEQTLRCTSGSFNSL